MEAKIRWMELVLGGTGVAVLFGVYQLGKDVGQGKLDGAVALERTIAEGRLNKKQEEIRQCERLNASLQAALQLDDKDRERLLEATAVTPPIAISLGDRPLQGTMELNAVGSEGCVELVLWFENTGRRTVTPAGGEIITSPEYVSADDTKPIYENAELRYRHWLRIDGPLPPGARRYATFKLCKLAEPPGTNLPPDTMPATKDFEKGERVPATLSLFADGFLPLKMPFELVFVSLQPSP